LIIKFLLDFYARSGSDGVSDTAFHWFHGPDTHKISIWPGTVNCASRAPQITV
jgi:hypothetical protein